MRRQSLVSRTLALFNRQERYELYLVTATAIVVALFELFGVASVMPFLAVVSRPEIVQENPFLARLWNWTSPADTNDFLFILGLLMLVVVLLTNVLNALAQWMIQRFIWLRHHSLSTRLLAGFLRQPWSFYLNKNTSELSAKILSEVLQFVGEFLLAGMQLLAQAVAVAAIVALLFVVDPILSAIVTAVVGGTYVMILFLVRTRQIQLGEVRHEANKERFRYAAEALSGIKDLKVNRLEQTFVALYERPSRRYSIAQSTNSVIALVPRYLLEVLAVGAVMIILLYELRVKGEVSNVVPTVGLYAFAGFRLLPKMQLMFFSASSMRFTARILDDLRHDLLELAANEEPSGIESPPFQQSFGLEKVTFRYPEAVQPALSSVTVRINKRSSVALVGSTGSGKTTCVDLLLGLMPPADGDHLVDGKSISGPELVGWRSQCGYVPQHIFISDDTIAANIAFGVDAEERNRDAIRRAARIANLDEFIEGELPHGYDTLVGERGVRLSGGQRQRLGIARALYRDPEVLVFDEATSALDNVTERGIMESIEELSGKKTIVIVAHRLSSVRNCDQIFVFDQGRVVSVGNWDELIDQCDVFTKLVRAADRNGAPQAFEGPE
jgi:ABC-type multidrug transport system fused ATPase/permease subunit